MVFDTLDMALNARQILALDMAFNMTINMLDMALNTRKSLHLTRNSTPGKFLSSIAATETPVLVEDALLHCLGLLLHKLA